jgi:hypothetical protein
VSILPDALPGWSPLLALFDREVIRALVPMIDRLSRAIGPMAADEAESSGDPAGYDGVSSRGTYDRLLPSEWLLAGELPDEFLRRAASREHLFYAMARQRPRGRRAATVLIDVGPESFGTPRIASLAALLVLAHRAASANAAFQWKLAQRHEESFTDVGARDVRAMLEARAAFIVDERAFGGAVEGAGATDEVWVVTGAAGARAAQRLGASVVSVEDVIDPSVRELAVSVRARGRRGIGTSLPLPDDRTCLRVLRDPFPRTAPAPLQRSARGELAIARPVLSPTRSEVFVRLAGGGVLVLPLPRSKRHDLGNGRLLQLDGSCGEIVAAGHIDGKPSIVAQRDYDFTLATWRGKREVTRRIGRSFEAARPMPMDGRLFPLLSLGDAVVFVGRGGRLIEFRPGNRARILVPDCYALAALVTGTTTIAESDDSTTLLRTIRDVSEKAAPWIRIGAARVLLATTSVGGVAVAYESGPGTWRAATFPPTAVGPRARKDEWAIPTLEQDGARLGATFALFRVAPSSEVVALLDHLAVDPNFKLRTNAVVRSSPAPLLLENEGRQLRLLTVGGSGDLTVSLPARAVHVVVDPATRVAVCVTDTAEVLVVALAWRSIFARFTGQGRVA